MYKIIFYHSLNGTSEIEEYLNSLHEQAMTSKNARIVHTKILAYMLELSRDGTRIGEPFVKHIDGDLWELRPLNNRLFFFYWKDDTFVFVHYFIKKSRKTPRREIDKANANVNEFLERNK